MSRYHHAAMLRPQPVWPSSPPAQLLMSQAGLLPACLPARPGSTSCPMMSCWRCCQRPRTHWLSSPLCTSALKQSSECLGGRGRRGVTGRVRSQVGGAAYHAVGERQRFKLPIQMITEHRGCACWLPACQESYIPPASMFDLGLCVILLAGSLYLSLMAPSVAWSHLRARRSPLQSPSTPQPQVIRVCVHLQCRCAGKARQQHASSQTARPELQQTAAAASKLHVMRARPTPVHACVLMPTCRSC